MLLNARNDGHWYKMPVAGRFSLEREEANSEEHLLKAVQWAQERMISAQDKMGSKYSGEGWNIQGPLSHIEFSEDASSDMGPASGPDPRDTVAFEKWSRAERARIGRKRGEISHLVDFTLTTNFWRKRRQELLTIAPSSGLLVPSHALAG